MSEDLSASHSRPSTEPGGALMDAEQELTDRVWQALQSVMAELPPTDRAVLALHNSFAFTYAEVALILGLEEAEVHAIAARLERKTSDWGAQLGSLRKPSASGGTAYAGEVSRTARADAPDPSRRPK
ncbi:sigma factor-like helix-turn-helix DNA-binding protein [Actinomadura scrupuli]|uniref:sigma factor-like helix-turn-helix DNA-binding protein n=1 Tax=Actinomadura scrupuli TaxID=559629 RepID=UPI003D9675F0